MPTPSSSFDNDVDTYVGINKYSHDTTLCVISRSASGSERSKFKVEMLSKERLTRIKHDGGPLSTLSNYLESSPLNHNHNGDKNNKKNKYTITQNNHHFPISDIDGLSSQSLQFCDKSDTLFPSISFTDDDGASSPLNFPFPPSATRELSHHLAHAYSTLPQSNLTSGLVAVIDGQGDTLQSSLNNLHNPSFKNDLQLFSSHYGSWHIEASSDLRSLLIKPGPGPQTPPPTSFTYRESESFYSYTSTSPSSPLRPLLKRYSSTRLPPHISSHGFVDFNSLGGLYSRLSTSIFKNWNACGKVMGLAPFGFNNDDCGEGYGYCGGDVRVVKVEEGGLKVDLDKLCGMPFSDVLKSGDIDFCETGGGVDVNSSGLIVKSSSPQVEKMIETCYEVQKDLERTVLKCLEDMAGGEEFEGKEKNLLLSGGVMLNSVLNGEIIRSKIFSNVYIPPFVGDEGIAFGCAAHGMLASNPDFETTDLEFGPYLGPEHDSKEMEEAFDEFSNFYTTIYSPDDSEDLYVKMAEIIAGGSVVALYEGRSEVGPRALGHRSILADPRRGGIVNFINSKIKLRESYRPFAPSVLAEDVGDWFEGGEGDISPYMSLTLFLKPDKRNMVNAVTHVDGSSRLQSVTSKRSPFYHLLIKSFKKLTGVPMLLNTSFNTLKNSPIVETPREAFVSWLARAPSLKYLVIDGKILERKSIKVLADDKFKAFGRFVTITNENYEGEITDVRIKMEGREEFGEEPLYDRLEVEILQMCDGSNTVADIASLLEEVPEDVMERVERMEKACILFKI
ncbi:hypothetical protein TrVE_jg1280 [Triparma verrucosa]|uniref:Uncharacterized protein n=1 Tax=Triparma verrucosa TaxID=1606542 RepID=A0A9W7EVL7_9STRA|nr:hypothetical protein TrVE_jg1280 [Triparma verrucosa]